MASTKKQEKASKKYYDSNKDYREKKIAKQIRKQKANKPKKKWYFIAIIFYTVILAKYKPILNVKH